MKVDLLSNQRNSFSKSNFPRNHFKDYKQQVRLESDHRQTNKKNNPRFRVSSAYPSNQGCVYEKSKENINEESLRNSRTNTNQSLTFQNSKRNTIQGKIMYNKFMTKREENMINRKKAYNTKEKQVSYDMDSTIKQESKYLEKIWNSNINNKLIVNNIIKQNQLLRGKIITIENDYQQLIKLSDKLGLDTLIYDEDDEIVLNQQVIKTILNNSEFWGIALKQKLRVFKDGLKNTEEKLEHQNQKFNNILFQRGNENLKNIAGFQFSSIQTLNNQCTTICNQNYGEQLVQIQMAKNKQIQLNQTVKEQENESQDLQRHFKTIILDQQILDREKLKFQKDIEQQEYQIELLKSKLTDICTMIDTNPNSILNAKQNYLDKQELINQLTKKNEAITNQQKEIEKMQTLFAEQKRKNILQYQDREKVLEQLREKNNKMDLQNQIIEKKIQKIFEKTAKFYLEQQNNSLENLENSQATSEII